VGWNGLSYRCLPYNQRWTHWACVTYVKETWWDYLYFSVVKFCIRCVVYILLFLKCFTDLWITRYIKLQGIGDLHTKQNIFKIITTNSTIYRNI
jgi:hypothetical protein